MMKRKRLTQPKVNLRLTDLRIGTEHEVGDVQALALLIADPYHKGLRPGDYFQRTAQSLLTGSILHPCYKARAERALTSLGALYEMLARGGRPLWTDMLKYGHINGQIHPVVAAVVRDMLDLPPSEAASVLGTARSCLKLRLQAAYG